MEPLAQYGVKFSIKPLYPRWLYELRKRSSNLILNVLTLSIAFPRLVAYSIIAFKFDIVLILRDVAPFSITPFIRMWKKLGKRIVFDFDDAIFINSPRIKDYVRLADVVTAGNDFLAEWAYKRNPCTKRIPTVIDIDRYPPKTSYETKAPLIIGWIGSPSTAPYLKAIIPILERLANKYPIEFRMIGGKVCEIPKAKTVMIEWSEETEVQEISQFDIGIAPMPDNEYTRGKCGLKVLQYMAAGIPVVASPVSVHRDIIGHGVNGFLADTEDEWVHYLQLLAENIDLRKTMGQQARRTVEERFSLDLMSKQVAELMKLLLSK